MVDVVTQQAAQEQHSEDVNAAETAAAEEMAQAAQDAAVTDTTAEEEAPSSEQEQWDDILEDEDESPEELKAEEKPAEEEETPEETPEEAKATEETPPAEEASPEDETPEVVVPVVEEPKDTRTPEEVNSEITKARETARESLVESLKWTEEQTEQFEEDPGAVMTSMAADLFLDLYDSISQGLRSQMPGMVQGMMAQQKAVAAAEQQFFGAWPQLAKAEYRETVDRISNAYRQQNPSMDDATAVKEIGAQAWVALRLPIEELMAHTQDVPTPTPSTPVITPTHVPASAGNTLQSARTPVVATGNEFENLADELLLDDE